MQSLLPEEAYVFNYIVKFGSFGSRFNVHNLITRFPFLRYVIPSEEIERICQTLVRKEFINFASSNDHTTFVIQLDRKNIPPPKYEELNIFMIHTYRSILERIPLSEFQPLNDHRINDPNLMSFSQLLAQGDWKWWDNVCNISLQYNKLLNENASINNFIEYICNKLKLTNCSIDGTESIMEKWLQEKVVCFTTEIEKITSWRDIRPCIFLVQGSLVLQKYNYLHAAINKMQNGGITAFLLFTIGDPDTQTRYILDAMSNVVIIYPEDLKKIALDRSLANTFRTIVKERSQLSSISPYRFEGPVPPDFFFGRESEISEILTKKTANYAIYGNRKIGKTSLLKKLQAIYQATPTSVVIYLDCQEGINSEAILSKKICEKLDLQVCKELSEFPEIIKKLGLEIIVLLDEIDCLLEKTDAKQLLGMFRALCNEGYMRFIVAGYMKLHKMSMDRQNPLYNFINSMRLEFLSDERAMELASKPMQNLGVVYEQSDSTVKQLLFYSSTNPSFIQMMCHQLVLLLDKDKRRIIRIEDIETVFSGKVFQEYVDGLFFVNLSLLEQLIVAQNLLTKYFDEALIFNKLEQAGLELSIEKVYNALQNLELIFLFEKNGPKYKYTYSQFPTIFKAQHDVEFLIKQLVEEIKRTMT